jgi:uncharacterized protein YjiS (DUF1127 family)
MQTGCRAMRPVVQARIAEMSTQKTRTPGPATRFALSRAQKPSGGGIFYRWYVRREQIRELNELLAGGEDRLRDIGVTRAEVEERLLILRRHRLPDRQS